MNVEDSYRYDQYYRLLELSDDEEVGREVKRLMDAQRKLDELERRIMDPDKAKGLAAAKQFLKETP